MATIPAVLEFTDGVRELTDDLDHLEAADALGALLSGETIPEDTAKIITMIYEVSLKKSNESTYMNQDNKPFYFWGHHMCGAIRCFSSDGVQEQRLFDLLEEISKQPDVTTSSGFVKKHDDSQVYWRDLPGWSFNLINGGLDYNHPANYGQGGEEEFLAQGVGLLNATRFAAKLLERGKFTTGLQRRASIVLWQTLEQNYDDTFGEAMLHLERQILLPAAATWVLVAGKTIYDHCVQEEIGRPDGDAGGGTLTSFSQRWEDWKPGFQKLAVSQDMSEEHRELALRTAQKMNEIQE